MIIEWAVLGMVICYIAFLFYKSSSTKAKVIPILILLIVSFLLMLPILPLSWLTLIGLFLFERLWILLAVILIIEMLAKREKIVLLTLFSVISFIMYFFLRTII